jgi:argininosuccinate lyase
VLANRDKIPTNLTVDKKRALDELNSDWTASQELADQLMRDHKLPFRVGHHFASEVVEYAKAHDIGPSEFPYDQARRIYRDTVKDGAGGELPMSEKASRAALDPVAIVDHRATAGGPQAAEMERMRKAAQQRLAQQDAWIKDRRARIEAALGTLDRDFDKLVPRREKAVPAQRHENGQ